MYMKQGRRILFPWDEVRVFLKTFGYKALRNHVTRRAFDAEVIPSNTSGWTGRKLTLLNLNTDQTRPHLGMFSWPQQALKSLGHSFPSLRWVPSPLQGDISPLLGMGGI